MDTKKSGFTSKLVHAGSVADKLGSAVTPIYQTSTFSFRDADHGARCFSGEEKGYIYTRIGNPNIEELEVAIAELENGFGGIAASSGMAAVNIVYLTLLGQGDHMISHNSVYGPSRGIMEKLYPKFGVEYNFVDTTNIQNIENAIKPNTKLLYLETPANPTMGITDLKAATELAHKHGIIVCVDNTFCSPYLQRPLDFGVDIVLHSMTKFINGHADIVGGIIVTKEEKLYNDLRYIMINVGFNMDPHQAWLARRGLKTLSIRLDKAQENSIKVAEYLESHPKIEWILYPGLKSHPHYELGLAQMDGPGAMISFGVKGGLEAGKKVMNNVHLALLAVSLGGIETLIQHPASMTHSKLSKEARETAGITDGLVRLSIGIENVEDIIADLDNALSKA
ncbi:MAG: aminotransferase class I/II-fold pyridoxal phosphate-dependent enzyme [Bacteroidetes bacterium]|nr:aminotransferase class I/II-fold pyridoxal phosphate-dependent enzyme [Bacteroidota bacterium]MBL6943710.1 aminotransferase class I/II-fold pyridoxal phosphate-dependent enzyme [Bacteroidales bacterium]